MDLAALKQLAATLAVHVARENIDVAEHDVAQVEDSLQVLVAHGRSFRPNEPGVDDHVAALVQKAGQLPPGPPGAAIVPELTQQAFACADCSVPVCGDTGVVNATNLANPNAARGCLRYLIDQFNKLHELVEQIVDDVVAPLHVAAPQTRLELCHHTGAAAVVASHRIEGAAHVITLGIDLTRFTERDFHSIAFELFRTLLARAWDGIGNPSARRVADADPFSDGFMTEISVRLFEHHLTDAILPDAAERIAQAHRQLDLRRPEYTFGVAEPPAVADIRLGVAAATKLRGLIARRVPAARVNELLFQWALGLLIHQPEDRRELIIERRLKPLQVEAIIGDFLARPGSWKFLETWNKFRKTFS